MRVDKRLLTASALGVAGFMLSIPVLPASAEFASENATPTETGQTFIAADVTALDAKASDATGSDASADASTLAAPVEELREDFTVSRYDLVMSPVPAGTPMGDGYGYRVPPCAGCSSFHKGVDWNPGAGSAVRAMANGTVSEIGNPSGGLGVYVVIDHVIDGRAVSTVYAHMAIGSLSLSVGDKVTAGDTVGAVGSTGQSTGPHLYFEIRVNGTTPVNPIPWLAAHVNA
jgi:murein DD-endopeptidase MepM/ murein hydrolase activator NlpD